MIGTTYGGKDVLAVAEQPKYLQVADILRKEIADGVFRDGQTLMTEEEFFAKIERAEKQPGKSFASVDELDKYIRSL